MKPSTLQADLVADLLVSMGGAAREPFEVEMADDDFIHHRVVAFDPAQFDGVAPHARLSDFAVRWQGPGVTMASAIRPFIAPDVPANRGCFVEYALYGYADGFLSLDESVDEVRELEADFPALRHPPHQLVTQRIANRGLTLEVDEDEGCLGDGWQLAKIAFLCAAIDRARWRRTAALFVAGAVSVEKTWDVSADPDADVLAELDAQPLRASRVVYGPRAWARRERVLRGRQSDGKLPSTARSPEELADGLGVEKVWSVCSYTDTDETDDGTRRPEKGQVLLFCGAERPTRNDFSNLKTFTAPAKTGERYAAYVSRVSDKRWRIGLECYETVAITSTLGLGIIAVG